MKLVWTKSNSPLSVLIRLITGQDCSHFAFVFESSASGLMFESNLLGTHPAFYASSLKTHTVVHEIKLDLTVQEEDAVWDIVVQKYDGLPYDITGALFIGWSRIRNRILGVPMPKFNEWGSPDKFFCDELVDVLKNVRGMPKIDSSGGMDTPHDVYEKIMAGIEAR